MSGRVGRLYYDCFGTFEGFDLRTCDRTLSFPVCGEAMERTVLQACRFDLLLTVWFEAAPCHEDPAHYRSGVALPELTNAAVRILPRICRLALGCC